MGGRARAGGGREQGRRSGEYAFAVRDPPKGTHTGGERYLPPSTSTSLPLPFDVLSTSFLSRFAVCTPRLAGDEPQCITTTTAVRRRRLQLLLLLLLLPDDDLTRAKWAGYAVTQITNSEKHSLHLSYHRHLIRHFQELLPANIIIQHNFS